MSTSEVAADATVLIFLAKLRRLDDLKMAHDSIIVPQAVYDEVVVAGREIGAKDAILVENAIQTGWITIVDNQRSPEITRFGLEDGETAVLSLALDRGHDEVLADEESVREVARLLGIAPRGTLSFLFSAVRSGELGFDGFLQELESLLDAGFYLDEAVYLEAVRTARQLSSQR